MRISADGFIDVRDGRRVRTPGIMTRDVAPVPEGEALAYLLSHSFPGHRQVVRGLSETHRKRIRLAMFADSVSERMNLVDRVWRAITAEVLPPSSWGEPELIQIVQFEAWAYPIYLDGSCTRVIPHGGLSVAELGSAPVFEMGVATA